MSSRLSQEITTRWKNGFTKVEVSGLGGSARAFLLADLIANSKQRIAIIAPNLISAERIHQDIKSFLKLLGHEQLVNDVDFFPGWEQSPYRAFHPSIKTRMRRLRVLKQIQRRATRAIILDVEALAQRCQPIHEIEAQSFVLRPGDTWTREELCTRLEAAGYTRNDPVEDPGTYTFRGSLFDVFSSSNRKPLRIDFFDETIESIKSYDPNSQRTEAQGIELAEIFPVSDFEFNEKSGTRAKTAIKEFCDHYGISKQIRDDVYEKIDAKIRDPLFEYLAPYFRENDGISVLEYLNQDQPWQIVAIDRLGIESSFDRFNLELKQGFERAIEEQKIVAPIEKLFLSADQFSDILNSKITLQFDDVSLGIEEESDLEEQSENFSQKIKGKQHTNSDLLPKNGTTTFEQLVEKTTLWAQRKWLRIFTASTLTQSERLSYLLSQKNVLCKVVSKIDWQDTSTIQIVEAQLSSGFRIAHENLVIVTDSEIFGPKKLQRTQNKRTTPEISMGSFIPSLEDLNPDELIVHHNHGIGRYRGLIKLEIDKIPQDFLLLEYAGADKLYLPVYRLDLVQKYAGSIETISLDKLGSGLFEKTKEKVKNQLQEIAHQLLQLYAKRASRNGFSFSPADETYRDFEAKFPYVETPDQLKAIEDVLNDMESGKIMDRLVCGDVGYGKTEVAMRAAFRAILDGKQVAVLVPTTVLALQHERSFKERFKEASVPANISMISRFRTNKEIKNELEKLKDGKLDIIIGTHRLLSKDVEFKDLGLIIVDEEQRFGVEHKERLKKLKITTDVLTLTATPIPRTLHMSLMGMRDISVINTAPVDRLSVRTYVARFDDNVVKNAIQQELARGGQVFFIHNRVQSINAMADRLHALIPEAKIIVAHGQLDEKQLEERMLDFYNKKGNVLLCSTIIESGLDIPSANTIIINRADMFGLAQLYQLRGRVGRSQLRAYCFLLLPEEGAVTEDAKKRLEILQKFVDLGSGFKIASHDLELRGGGDLLGKSQSGQIAAVGYELYTDLLDETIRELKGEELVDHFDPEIKLPVAALLPESYVPEVHQRLGLYKRLSQAPNGDALRDLEVELQDRFGELPEEVQNLVWLIKMKQLLRKCHIKSLVVGKERISLDASGEAKIDPQKIFSIIKKGDKSISITPDSKIILRRPFLSSQHLYQDLERFVDLVAQV